MLHYFNIAGWTAAIHPRGSLLGDPAKGGVTSGNRPQTESKTESEGNA